MSEPRVTLISGTRAVKWPRYEIHTERWLCNRCAERVAFTALAEVGYGPPVLIQQFQYDAHTGRIDTRVDARFRRTAGGADDSRGDAHEVVWPYPAAELFVLSCTRCARKPPGRWGVADVGGSRKNEPKITDLAGYAACAWDGKGTSGFSPENKRALLALCGLPLELEVLSWMQINRNQENRLIEAMRYVAHRFGSARDESPEKQLARFLWDHVFQRAPD